MNYQWYPGHMTKAVRRMQEDIKLIDLIIEIVDARAPLSSRNPDIDELGKGKVRMVLLNKADLADPEANRAWIEHFTGLGIYALELNSKAGTGIKEISPAVSKACAEKIERDKKRGIKNRPIRAMVVGIPNVGKSTFINSLSGRAVTKTGNKPGVTKGKQWIKAGKDLELLDTPGILWPKFEDNDIGMRLAFIGSINDEIIVMEEMAADLIGYLDKIYPEVVTKYYGITTAGDSYHVLNAIGGKRGCLKAGGDIDMVKAARLLIDDYRAGRLGRMSLERP